MASELDVLVDLLGTLSEQAPAWADGVVTAVDPTGGEDGKSLVTVNWNGTLVKLAHLSSYTPAVGHVVLMARYKSKLAILGQLIGTPPTSATL